MCKHMLSLCGCVHVPSESRAGPGPLELEFQKWRVLETEQDTTFSSENAVEWVNTWTQSFSNSSLSLRKRQFYHCFTANPDTALTPGNGESRGVQKLPQCPETTRSQCSCDTA